MTFTAPFFWITLVSVLGILLLGILIWFVIFSTRVILSIFLNIPITAEPFKREEGILHYSVNLKSRDGVSIKGFFLPSKNSQGRTVVFCHEIGAGAASFQKYASFLRERGFNIFTFDFRGHGLSGNSNGYVPRQWVTQYEVRDLRTVLRSLKRNNEVDSNRIGLFGISKGGGTAIIAGAKTKGVKAIVSDGAFSTSYTIADYFKKWVPIYLRVELLPIGFYWFFRVWTLWVVSKKLKCRFPSLEKAITKLKPCALFLIHGQKDNYISAEQSKRLYTLAHEPRQNWIVPKARHNEAVKLYPEEYAEKITAFFEKYL